MAKKFNIKSQGQKLVPLEKEYIPSDWTSGTKIWMTDAQGGHLSEHKRIILNYNFG